MCVNHLKASIFITLLNTDMHANIAFDHERYFSKIDPFEGNFLKKIAHFTGNFFIKCIWYM